VTDSTAIDNIDAVLSREAQYCIVHGDNLEVVENLIWSRHGSPQVSLVYMDPPFGTGDVQSAQSGSYDDTESREALVEKITDLAQYFSVVLSPSGSLVVHVDWRLSAKVRVAFEEERFSRNTELQFASEIIWRYRRWPAKTRNFQRVHDTLLRYVKDPEQVTWNQLYEPLAKSTQKTFGNKKQRALFVDGERTKSEIGDDESPGCPMGDVWDIGILAPQSKERVGWPTQKPEALLERLILASTNPGDLVIDPYMGSGTTIAVAVKLGRRAIGIDREEQAVEVATQRVRSLLQSGM